MGKGGGLVDFLFGVKTVKGVSKAKKVGVLGGAFRKGGALSFRRGTKFRPIKTILSKGDEVPSGAKVVGQGATLDDAFKGLGVKPYAKGGYPIPKGHYIIDAGGNIIAVGGKSTATMSTKWTKGMKIVSVSRKLPKAVKTARMAKVIATARSTGISLPGVGKTFKVGIFIGMGYGLYRALGIIGTFSDTAEDIINNFYGVNCDDDDVECQTQGAKNMLATGVLGVVVIGGLAYFMLKPKKEASSTK